MAEREPVDLEEIFEYALDQETKAGEFYGRNADRIENVEAATLFKSLARMEVGHKRALEAELRILRESGQIVERPKETHFVKPQEELLTAFQRVTRVLREANVELVGRTKRIEAEMEIAAEVQMSMLPDTVPQLVGLDVSVACRMARQLGGDFYDFLMNPQGQLGLTLGDVSGKGMPAALLMMAIRTLWRSRVRDGHNPAKVMTLLTQDVSAELGEGDHFVTMIAATYDIELSTLFYANAGHWSPIYVSNTGELDVFSPAYLPIGMDPDTHYEGHEIRLHEEDVLVLFSDGIVEARDETGEEFGGERLEGLVHYNRDSTAEEIRDAILLDLDGFAHEKRDDDQTLMVLKKTE